MLEAIIISAILMAIVMAIGLFADSASQKLKLPNLGSIVTICLVGAVLLVAVLLQK